MQNRLTRNVPKDREQPQGPEFPQDRGGRKGNTTGSGRKGKVDHKGRNSQATKKAAPERFVSRSGAASVRSVMRSCDDRFF